MRLTYSRKTARVRPATKIPRWVKGTVIMAMLAWCGLAIVSYMSLPMFQMSWWFSKLVTAAGAVPAILWSVTAVMTYVSFKAYVRSFAVLMITALLGVVVFRIDWQTLYIDSQLQFHRGELAALVVENQSHRPLTVPWWMKYLSIDGQVRQQGAVLYLPVFEDSWRGETGSGIAYLPVPPNSETVVQTASGDIGRPVRDLGNGWWWVE